MRSKFRKLLFSSLFAVTLLLATDIPCGPETVSCDTGQNACPWYWPFPCW
jgi:hypothetical protein